MAAVASTDGGSTTAAAIVGGGSVQAAPQSEPAAAPSVAAYTMPAAAHYAAPATYVQHPMYPQAVSMGYHQPIYHQPMEAEHMYQAPMHTGAQMQYVVGEDGQLQLVHDGQMPLYHQEGLYHEPHPDAQGQFVMGEDGQLYHAPVPMAYQTEDGQIIYHEQAHVPYLPSVPSMVAYSPDVTIYNSAEEARAAAQNRLPPWLQAQQEEEAAATADSAEAAPSPEATQMGKAAKTKRSRKVPSKKKACC